MSAWYRGRCRNPIPSSTPAAPATSPIRWRAKKAGACSCRRCCPGKCWKAPLNIYKKACAEHGHQPDIVYIRPVYIDEDEKQIRKEVEQALLNFLAFNASPVESIQSEEKKAELRAKGYGFYASGALESLTKLTYDEIVEQEIGFIGTPEKVSGRSARCKRKAASVNWRSSQILAGWSTGRASRYNTCSRST